MEKNPQTVQASSVIEAKLTKTEAIEIMVDDLLKELRRALKNAEAEFDKLKVVDIKDVMNHLDGKVSISYSDSSYWNNPDKTPVFNFSIEHTRVPENTIFRDSKLGDRARRLKELSKEITQLGKQIHSLENDKAATKVTLLKTILEGTPEGREWLNQLDTIRRSAAKRFNIKIDPRLLAGKS